MTWLTRLRDWWHGVDSAWHPTGITYRYTGFDESKQIEAGVRARAREAARRQVEHGLSRPKAEIVRLRREA